MKCREANLGLAFLRFLQMSTDVTTIHHTHPREYRGEGDKRTPYCDKFVKSGAENSFIGT
jgi:hypothetical protein